MRDPKRRFQIGYIKLYNFFTSELANILNINTSLNTFPNFNFWFIYDCFWIRKFWITEAKTKRIHRIVINKLVGSIIHTVVRVIRKLTQWLWKCYGQPTGRIYTSENDVRNGIASLFSWVPNIKYGINQGLNFLKFNCRPSKGNQYYGFCFSLFSNTFDIIDLIFWELYIYSISIGIGSNSISFLSFNEGRNTHK